MIETQGNWVVRIPFPTDPPDQPRVYRPDGTFAGILRMVYEDRRPIMICDSDRMDSVIYYLTFCPANGMGRTVTIKTRQAEIIYENRLSIDKITQ